MTRTSAATGGRPCLSDIRENETVIRAVTDEINQPRIARDNSQDKTALVARKERVSTAINNARQTLRSMRGEHRKTLRLGGHGAGHPPNFQIDRDTRAAAVPILSVIKNTGNIAG
jgi:hypothetical protein